MGVTDLVAAWDVVEGDGVLGGAVGAGDFEVDGEVEVFGVGLGGVEVGGDGGWVGPGDGVGVHGVDEEFGGFEGWEVEVALAGGGRFEGEDADAGVGAADGGGEGGVDGGGVLGRVGVDMAGHASGDVLGAGEPALDAVGGGVGVGVFPGW